MQLDDLKEAWAAQEKRLERSLEIDERLVRHVTERRVRSTLTPYLLRRALEVAVGLAAVILVGSVLVAHLGEPPYVLVVGALHVFAIAMTASSGYLLVRVARLDLGGPVTAIQREIERIKLLEYRAFKWALLGGILLWLPAAMVLYEAVSGIDVLARAHPLWLAANLVLGVAVLAIGQTLSRTLVERPDLSPWARRLVDRVSGRSLRRVTEFLGELEQFEREDAA